MIFKRLKNLWKLSAFAPKLNEHDKFYTIAKDISTIKPKLATIIKDDSRTVLEKEIDENTNNTV